MPTRSGCLGAGLWCGRSNQPVRGAGKLPWKLEWVAKWKVLPVTVEGAGKDHMGAGGSHKVADGAGPRGSRLSGADFVLL